MNNKEKAFAYVDEHIDEFIAELGSACAIPSTAGNASARELMRERLAYDLAALGARPEFHPVEGGNALISARLSGDKDSTLLFYNHYDVVEPGDPEKWTNGDPFHADVRDGVIYARGVSDNKGGLYCRLHAVRAVLAAAGKLPVSVKFLFEGDEEIGSPSMERFASGNKDEFFHMIDAAVCLWENGRIDNNGHPWLRCGVRASVAFDLSVTTSSTDVHGRMGTTVPSASWRLVWSLACLKDSVTERVLLPGFYDRVLPVTDSDREVLKAFPFDEAHLKEKLNLDHFMRYATGQKLKEQMYMEPVMSICGLEAGEMYKGKRGIVPHTASARVSFYMAAEQDPDEIAVQLRQRLDDCGFEDVKIERRGGRKRSIRTPVDHPFVECARRSAVETFDQSLVIELTQLGGGPASILRDVKPDLPVFGLGPANTSANHHAPDENMKIEDYKKAIKHLIAIMYSY